VNVTIWHKNLQHAYVKQSTTWNEKINFTRNTKIGARDLIQFEMWEDSPKENKQLKKIVFVSEIITIYRTNMRSKPCTHYATHQAIM